MRFLVLAFLAACTSSASSSGAAGTSCKTTSDCASGLSCVGLAVYSDGGACTTAANACSKTCTSDGDCASLGPKFRCFAGCPGAPQSCGQTP